jgi:hypothetical protein
MYFFARQDTYTILLLVLLLITKRTVWHNIVVYLDATKKVHGGRLISGIPLELSTPIQLCGTTMMVKFFETLPSRRHLLHRYWSVRFVCFI